MRAPYTLDFTLRDGRLERDDGRGLGSGSLRTVDPARRAFTFGDARTFSFDQLSAVAVVYTEKEVPDPASRSLSPPSIRAMRFSIALVPGTLRGEVRALLEAIARGEPPPVGSIRIAAEMVEQASIHAMSPSGAEGARREGKAIAQVAGLPLFELYGEPPFFRPAGQLERSLIESLRARGDVVDPGPPPPGVDAREIDGRLVVSLGAPPSQRLAMALIGLASIAIGVLLIVFADWRPGLFALATGLIVLAITHQTPAPRASSLVVGPTAIEWTGASSEDRVELASLEAIRVADDGALVLIGPRDEVRCPVGGLAAPWIRAAIERRLSPRSGTYR